MDKPMDRSIQVDGRMQMRITNYGISSTLAYGSYEISLLCTCIYVISNLYKVMYLDAHKRDYIH